MKLTRLNLLLATPLICYLLSYIYLSFYHHNLFIFNDIIHENGKNTLLQTIFYASHFLGHIPTHTIIALYFTGCLRCFHDTSFSKTYLIELIIFLLVTLIISLSYFGFDDTFAYLLQTRQQASDYSRGGSWNLHLPSTILLFFLIPFYIFISFQFLGKEINQNNRGRKQIIFAIILFIIISILINIKNLNDIIFSLTEPRYLAHSVRELATFPITYFPLVLYYYFTNSDIQKCHNKINSIILYSFLVFICLFLFQVHSALNVGINNLSQKPNFAVGNLSVCYLLASHYFEHFLDTIYFYLISASLLSYNNN